MITCGGDTVEHPIDSTSEAAILVRALGYGTGTERPRAPWARPVLRHRARRGRVGVIALLASAALAVSLTGCSSSSSSPTDAVAGSTQVLVALPLNVDQSGLAQAADDVADRSSPKYHHFLTVTEIAAQYGASASTIQADQQILTRAGLHLEPDATHGALWGVVTASEAEAAFGTTLVDDSGTIEPATAPHVPSGLEGVSGVVGLDASASLPAVVNGGSAEPACPAQIPTAASVSNLYGFSGLVDAGLNGSGASVDILAIHTLVPAIFTNYDRCTGANVTTSSITQLTTPAAPDAPGGTEVALDAIVIRLLAPGAHLGVVRYDPVTSLAFPLMTLLGQTSLPDVVDITVTYCEDQLPATDVSLSEWLLSAMAAAGTSTVAATGDMGSSGCYPDTTTPAVTYPASSAFVAAVGGASYTGTASDPQDLAVWNTAGSVGAGGGTSITIKAPPWQSSSGNRRLPDVSAFAVPGGIGEIPVCGSSQDCLWSAEGGTSVAATVLGATGLLLAQRYSSASGPARWGNVAQALWRHEPDAVAITDVTQGSNATFNSQCCQATAGYDTASGWGLIIPDGLADLLGPA